MTVIASASRMPEGMNLEVRNLKFELREQLSKDWLDNDPFKTAFFNALSMTFPAGERFFIESVRHYKDNVKDPKLKKEMSGFFGQEGMHSREHRNYNQMLCDLRGYSQKKMEGRTEKMVRLGKEKMRPIAQLAATCGVEHLTAILADKILNGWMLSNVDPRMRSLWEWHSAEELEHKSVAYDVYTDVGGTYKSRKLTLRIFTVNFLLNLLANTAYMLRKDKKLWKWSTLKSGFKFLFAKGGVLREMRRDYLMYFDPDFHPWDDDNRHLLESWQAPQTT
ncbi:MAG: metal-dependent hydrolase [Pseudomonadales bacterium]